MSRKCQLELTKAEIKDAWDAFINKNKIEILKGLPLL